MDELFLSKSTPISGFQIPLLAGSRIFSGAAHFLLHISETALYSLGDNRHFQLGDNLRTSWNTARQITFFEGGSFIEKVACGDLHTAILTEDGALYVSGSNANGQCGGFCQQEPCLLQFQGFRQDEQPDVLDMTCGSNHTVINTNNGVYVAGSSKSPVSAYCRNGRID